ncbi:DUF262 domain-containing protein [Rhodopseudomonas palustris]|uniref:DUF262 domain-containing protein n=1 Tax=Rhodopseudomonas palustris TaxID=1076 RepID=UPI000E5BA190|nr:DUF262 domain-containing protein [Rhodopseudomonas palustris]QLH70991.1 DUF262 domain-containing protein [Rhodopseudomonas palustris]RIA01637.1 DUF262 domain-containing protein [Rhodopseudomonas palustris]
MTASQNLLPVYQTLDLPLKSILNEIHQSRWVLPAIQREFVWSDQQICRLFDSMMRGYPFGTFLFWQIEGSTASKFKFYEFMRRYHERDAKTCRELPALGDRQVIAVLDGQQRLTALNIGLAGSRAMKLPNKRRSNNQAYPETFLHLDLLGEGAEQEDGMVYDFRFLTLEKAAEQSRPAENHIWFRVGDSLQLKEGIGIFERVQQHELNRDQQTVAFERLDLLHRLVHKTPLISCYTERVQDLGRVLDIFIRMNSGGTVLSYSDLLFSIAVANWTELDARREVNEIVDALNGVGGGFSFSKDFVLKAGLMLAEIKSVGFKVENFDRTNMATLERAWPAIRQALDLTVRLVSNFGFTGQTLRADSALLPIAYYLFKRKAQQDFLTHSRHSDDRRNILRWLARSYLKASGIWGSGLDTLLTSLREVVATQGTNAFPATQIEEEMARRGKTLSFTPDELDDLVELPYGDSRTFALLTLIFETVDTSKSLHMDHIVPISKFKRRLLLAEGVQEAAIEEWSEQANTLPNLQLIEGAINQEKLAMMPADWLRMREPDDLRREKYIYLHMLEGLPEKLGDFEVFYQRRRRSLQSQIALLLGGSGAESASAPKSSAA